MTLDIDDTEVLTGAVIRLVIPADARFLRIARLTAAAIASDLGFSLDAIEDLRIAVDEACAAVITDASPESELSLVYLPAIDGRSIAVEGTCTNEGGSASGPIPMHPVAAELLDLTTTSHAVWSHDEGRSFRFDKVVEGPGAGT